MKTLVKYVYIFIFYLLNVIYALSQPNTLQSNNRNEFVEKLKKIRVNVNIVASKNKNLYEELKAINLSCRELTNQAIYQIQTNRDLVVSSEYIASLDNLLTFSEKAKDISSSKSFELLKLINKDLEIKFKPQKGTMSTGVFPQLAAVNVRTLSDSGEVKNLRIHYAPLGFNIDYTKDYYVFPKLSSPTSVDIVPGFYIFFIKNNINKTISILNQEITPYKKNEIDMMIK